MRFSVQNDLYHVGFKLILKYNILFSYMNIVIINGPNLNLLGEREPKIYGKETLKSIEKKCKEHAKKNKIKIDFFQSNIEGEIVTKIQKSRAKFDGLIINAAAFTHTSVAILDALNLVKIPKIEIHISNIFNREEFRHKSLISGAVNGLICGLGSYGYILSIDAIKKIIKDNK
ncbi:3-dehydroquinate dehydratase [Candidatus Pelagibacterales bacterium]|nr:3-dehydroquinate dehydratase [Pelagibacterales bacterium]